MYINKDGAWVQGQPLVKVANQWKLPTNLYVKQAGVWLTGLDGTLVWHDPRDLLVNKTSWQYSPERGCFKDTYTWGAQSLLGVSPDVLKRIKRVSGVFTGYYNLPAGCIGESMIFIRLSNGTGVSLGTGDAWDLAASGQQIFTTGNMGTVIYSNVVNQEYFYDIPAGLEVTELYLISNGFYGNGIYYPISRRGIADLKLSLK